MMHFKLLISSLLNAIQKSKWTCHLENSSMVEGNNISRLLPDERQETDIDID